MSRRLMELVVGKLFTPFTPGEYRAWSDSLAARVADVARAPGRTFPIGPTFGAAHTSVALSDLIDGPSSTERRVTLQRLEVAPEVAIEAVSAEPVAEYGLAVRAVAPPGRIVIPVGYTDSVFGYLPTARMLGQHGYEDEGFMEPFGLSGRFRPEVEQVVGRAWGQLRKS